MNYFEMYKDIWQFHKKYGDSICNDDDYWKAVANESDVISEKYGDCKFIRNLVLNEIAEFERLYRERRNHADRRI